MSGPRGARTRRQRGRRRRETPDDQGLRAALLVIAALAGLLTLSLAALGAVLHVVGF